MPPRFRQPSFSKSAFHYVVRSSFQLFIALLLTGVVSPQNDKDARSLGLGKSIERELSGAQVHSYRIILTSGEYLHLVVDQRGIDLIVKLFGPDGKKIVEVDGPNGTTGPEPVFAIAESSGTHIVEVRSLEKDTPGGRYEVKVQELRKATEEDRQRIVAERAFMRATLLRAQGTAESLQSAIKAYEGTLSLYRQVKEQKGEATTLMSIGEIYSSLGEKRRALSYFTEALKIYRAAMDRIGEAETLNNIGVVYDDLGDKEKALTFYEEALPLRRLVDDRNGEATTLVNIGVVYGSLGEREKALNYFARALPALQAVGDRRGEAATLSNIGGIYSDLGDNQRALDYYERSLVLARLVGDRRGEAVTLSNIGGVYKDLGDKQKALNYYGLALPIRRLVGDRDGEAATLLSIAAVNDDLGDSKRAIDYYQQALTLFRDVGNRYGEAVALGGIGVVYQSSGEQQKALEYFAQALPIKRALGDRRGEAATLNTLMSLYQSVANRPLAIFYGKEALDVLQQMRSSIHGLGIDVQRTYLKSVEFTYRGLADLLITEDRSPEALQVLTAFKDQQFFDFDRPQALRLETVVRTPRELEFASRYRKATDAIGSMHSHFAELKGQLSVRQPEAEEAAQLQMLQTQLRTSSDDFLHLLKQAEVEFSKSSDKEDDVRAESTSEIQAALLRLDEQTGQKTVAVYAIVGVRKFRALIVSRDGVISVSPPISGTEVNDKARQLWQLLRSPDYDPSPLLQDLYFVIFKPIEDKLPKDTKTIMWSLDGNLHYLPFAALYDGEHYLVERFNNVVFTRADQERLTRNVSSIWTGYGFVSSASHKVDVAGKSIEFSALDFAKKEMQIFRTKSNSTGLVEGDVFAEAQFTKSALFGLKTPRPLIHISSHFRFRPGDEFSSFLVLGDGHTMTLAELKKHANLFQGVELLTLSACDTAAQQPDANGKEIDAFAELAQRLGAASVMASLWSVSERSTADLMKAFYRNRQGGKYTKAEALRQAQLDLLYGRNSAAPVLDVASRSATASTKGKKNSDDEVVVNKRHLIPFKPDPKRPFAHPYYWSPFVLFGNWK